MSDGFLKRWSRKKRAPTAEPTPPEVARAEALPARTGQDVVPANAPHGAQGDETIPPAPAGEGGAATQPPSSNEEEPFDPASLPPIESLGAESDYTAFLKKGVPEALKLAALRKAWMSDPKIRDFRSPATEYGWDFTTPEYALRPTDDVAKLVDQVLGAKRADPVPATPAASPAIAAAPASVSSPPQEEAEAPAKAEVPESDTDQRHEPRRKHGGALPS